MNLNIEPPLPARKDFRIGILGAGFIVNDCHLVAYRKAGFNPVAIASRTRASAERVAARHNISKVHDSYDDLLADPSIEVLDIAVPPNAQLALIKQACERKTVKGILAQKPLGMNYAEAVEAVRACEAAGIVLSVNQNMRYDPSVRAAKTLLENGAIGEPVFATIDMRAIPHWMPWQKDLGWVTLRIMSIHHLDCFRFWFGDPEGIYCSVRTDPRTQFPHTDGICTYILEYKNGMRCVGIDDTWTGPAKEGCPGDQRIQWRIEGTNGLAMGDIGWCKEPYTTPSTIRYASKGDKTFHEPKFEQSWFPDAFIGTMGQLLVALETGKEPAISGQDNLKTMSLVDAAYRSIRKLPSITIGQAISLDPEGNQLFNTPYEGQKIVADRPSFLKRLFARFGELGTPKLKPQSTDTASEPFSKKPARVPSLTYEGLNNFTPRAQQVLALARREADRFNHNFVGTEHLLLGLVALNQGTAVAVLHKLGLDLETVREEVEKQVGTGPDQKTTGSIPFTPRVKKVLAFAAKEAKALNHTYVGTEHILLGILRQGDGVAARVLKNLDINIEQTRLAILKELDPNREP
jgi:predicted dehydrogenase